MIMKKALFLLFAAFAPLMATAQEARPFDVTISNDEYKIYITMDLHDKDVTVPGQDVLGQVDGYFGSRQGRTTWIIISSTIINERTAEIEVVNDYGSEDFKAELKLNPDGSYSYKKKGGSTLKFAVRGKWQKIPGSLKFAKK